MTESYIPQLLKEAKRDEWAIKMEFLRGIIASSVAKRDQTR